MAKKQTKKDTELNAHERAALLYYINPFELLDDREKRQMTYFIAKARTDWSNAKGEVTEGSREVMISKFFNRSNVIDFINRNRKQFQDIINTEQLEKDNTDLTEKDYNKKVVEAFAKITDPSEIIKASPIVQKIKKFNVEADQEKRVHYYIPLSCYKCPLYNQASKEQKQRADLHKAKAMQTIQKQD